MARLWPRIETSRTGRAGARPFTEHPQPSVAAVNLPGSAGHWLWRAGLSSSPSSNLRRSNAQGRMALPGGRMIHPSSSPTATKSPHTTHRAVNAQTKAVRSSWFVTVLGSMTMERPGRQCLTSHDRPPTESLRHGAGLPPSHMRACRLLSYRRGGCWGEWR